MENHPEQEKFSYTYSAKEQAEIDRIRRKYMPTQDKMERLRQLDRRVTQKAQAVSLALGIIGALILGCGMSLAMTDLGEMLGAHRALAMLIGIAVGIVGGVLVSLAYPVYSHIVKRERRQIAPEILRLTDELMK